MEHETPEYHDIPNIRLIGWNASVSKMARRFSPCMIGFRFSATSGRKNPAWSKRKRLSL
jgi:hypothetical protein